VDSEHTDERLHELKLALDENQRAEIERLRAELRPADLALLLTRLGEAPRQRLLAALAPDQARDVLGLLPDVHASQMLESLEPRAAAAIVEEMTSAERADVLADMDARHRDSIGDYLEPDTAADMRRLVQYPALVAGGLMITEFLAYQSSHTAAEVVDDMRRNADRYRDYDVQYAFVVEPDGRLVGVLRLRDLLLANPHATLQALMIPDPLTVGDWADLDHLGRFFDAHPWYGVPVVDEYHRMLGVVQRTAVAGAIGDRADVDYLKSQGIVREELRTMPLWVRSRRRLAWLSANVGLNIIAASVIAWYQETLAQVIALAVFLPIISDMSGCSGNQAVAVSMRELTLGLLRPGEFPRVWLKEIGVGLINGLALGLLIAAVAWAWKGNPMLGLVVGAALGTNTLIAVLLGGSLPLVMRLLKLDPALASGPILTTITDLCGFVLVLSLAAAAMPFLKG
jgi:magnesium transporter